MVAYVVSCYVVRQVQQILLWYLKRLKEATTNLFCIFSSNNVFEFIIIGTLLNLLGEVPFFFLFLVLNFTCKIMKPRRLVKLFTQINIPVYDHLLCNHLWSEAAQCSRPKPWYHRWTDPSGIWWEVERMDGSWKQYAKRKKPSHQRPHTLSDSIVICKLMKMPYDQERLGVF